MFESTEIALTNPNIGLDQVRNAFRVVAGSYVKPEAVEQCIVQHGGKKNEAIYIMGSCSIALTADPTGKLLQDLNKQFPEVYPVWGEFVKGPIYKSKDGSAHIYQWQAKKHTVLRDETGPYVLHEGKKHYVDWFTPVVIPHEEPLMPIRRNPATVPVTTAGSGPVVITPPPPIVVKKPSHNNPHGISVAQIKDATVKAVRSAMAEAGDPISLAEAKKAVFVRDGIVHIGGGPFHEYEASGGDIDFEAYLPKHIREIGYFDNGPPLFFSVHVSAKKKSQLKQRSAQRKGEVMVARWGGKECPRCGREIERGDEIMDTGERGPRGGKVTAHASCVQGRPHRRQASAKVKAKPASGRKVRSSQKHWAFQWIGGGWNTVDADSHNEALRKAKKLGEKNDLRVKKGSLKVATKADMQMVAHNYRRNPVSALMNPIAFTNGLKKSSGRKTRSAISSELFFTSKGQPYIIGSNGKAKFISMEAAQEMEKRIEDPGRYRNNPVSALMNPIALTNGRRRRGDAARRIGNMPGKVYFTSNGQPYVMEDGRPKFIKRTDRRAIAAMKEE